MKSLPKEYLKWLGESLIVIIFYKNSLLGSLLLRVESKQSQMSMK